MMTRHNYMDNSPLMRLPPELRNHIYDFAIGEGRAITVADYRHPQVPTVLHICRQARAEASSVYYSTHVFVAESQFGPSLALKDWLSMIGPKGRALIRAIHMKPLLTGFSLATAEVSSRLCAEELEIDGVAVPKESVKVPYFERAGWPPGRELWASAK